MAHLQRDFSKYNEEKVITESQRAYIADPSRAGLHTEEFSPDSNIICDFSGPTIGNFKVSTWWGKAGLSTTVMVHDQWMIVSKGSYSQGVRPQEPAFQSCSILKKSESASCSVLSDSLQPHSPPRVFYSWNSPGKNTRVGCHSLLLGSRQMPSLSASAKAFLRKWEGRGELEDAFPHSDSVLSTFPFLALSPSSAPSPRDRTVKLLFQVSSTMRQTTSVLIHCTVLWGKMKQDS